MAFKSPIAAEFCHGKCIIDCLFLLMEKFQRAFRNFISSLNKTPRRLPMLANLFSFNILQQDPPIHLITFSEDLYCQASNTPIVLFFRSLINTRLWGTQAHVTVDTQPDWGHTDEVVIACLLTSDLTSGTKGSKGKPLAVYSSWKFKPGNKKNTNRPIIVKP